MKLELTYWIDVDFETSDFERLLEETTQAFCPKYEFAKYAGLPSVPTCSVRYSTTGHASSLQLDVTLEEEAIDLARAGMAGVLSLILGNPFRDTRIKRVRLTNLRIAQLDQACFRGPLLGTALGPHLAAQRAPLLSFSMPRDLDRASWRLAVQAFVNNGGNIVTDQQFESPDRDEIAWRLDTMSALASASDRSVAYFVDILQASRSAEIAVSSLHHDDPRVLVGARLCPISAGLNYCAELRERNVPLMGYNTLDFTHDAKRAVSPSVYALMIRLVGCDCVNLGLYTSDLMNTPVLGEIVAALRDPSCGVPEALPMYTGGVTPRVAFDAVRRFGSDLVLHTRRAISRAGTDWGRMGANVEAIVAAANLGTGTETWDDLVGSERRPTRAIRRYLDEYGG